MNIEKAKADAAAYLAARPRTEAEVRGRLKKKGYQEEEIEETIRVLLEYGYIDDFQYCREYYRYAAARDRGSLRIEAELTAKGAERRIIRAALASIRDEEGGEISGEKERAQKAVQKFVRERKAEGKPFDQKFAGRLARRLSNLGYDTEIVYSVLRKVMEEEKNE